MMNIKNPPNYCEYALGPCDHSFSGIGSHKGFFVYPSQPSTIAHTVKSSLSLLQQIKRNQWIGWEDLNISGKIIFCTICKQIRFSDFVIADVTTLNFNVLFEIGFSLGLGISVLPIRDTTYLRDKQIFNALGLLDTLGYFDFTNAQELASKIRLSNLTPLSDMRDYDINRMQPLYIIKPHIETEGAIISMSNLKKGALRFRTFDPKENTRLTVGQAVKDVTTSLGVIVHLIDNNRTDAAVHNARCAFIAGMAMAKQCNVMMLQEGLEEQPIDYRDLIKYYYSPDEIPNTLNAFSHVVIGRLQEHTKKVLHAPENILHQLDLGDVAAENEISRLHDYFVQTGDFLNVRRGHARLVVGNKGTGKTAIFYQVRDHHRASNEKIVLDLKPEGHQFTKLRETVLDQMPIGMQEHTMTAFWYYLLLTEIAHKIISDERRWVNRNPALLEPYEQIKSTYEGIKREDHGDFSERLLRLVDSIIDVRSAHAGPIDGGTLTTTIYTKSISDLVQAISGYLKHKNAVWILVDNLDKGWPVHGATAGDILILRSLLEASRKIQRQFERDHVDLKASIFVRYDIYEHLLAQTPDRGKDPATKLYWSDPSLFKQILTRRIAASTELSGEFDDIWRTIFDIKVGDENSLHYILRRSFGRPRSFLKFISRAIEVAISRGHSSVTQEDIRHAEVSYSEDMLLDIGFELRDINHEYEKALYSFMESAPQLSLVDIEKALKDGDFEQKTIPSLINLLIWFGFLGIVKENNDMIFSYDVQHNIDKLMKRPREKQYIINPTFWAALECPVLSSPYPAVRW